MQTLTSQLRSKRQKVVSIFLFLVCAFLVCTALGATFAAGQVPAPATSHGAPHDPQTDAAFEHFYNMEYDRA